MQVNVISSVNEARSDDLLNKTVIVIDVLRATSTIVTALSHGCSGIMPVETVQQAKQLQLPGDLLGGERFCKKIAGFHYGNSPLEFMTPDIAGSRIILTTTNGTRAIQKSIRADYVLAGSLLNATACARKALELRRDIAIMCSGTQDEFSLEDGLCAGLIVRELLQEIGEASTDVNDLGIAMLHTYAAAEPELEHIMFTCTNGRRLSRMGLESDVSFCAQVNLYPLVPVLDGELMR